jgi:hypothetical protein
MLKINITKSNDDGEIEEVIITSPDGSSSVKVYDESGIGSIGEVERMKRASHVDYDNNLKGWVADMSPLGGSLLGPFKLHSEAIRAERIYINNLSVLKLQEFMEDE